jgi:hypothetical protein
MFQSHSRSRSGSFHPTPPSSPPDSDDEIETHFIQYDGSQESDPDGPFYMSSNLPSKQCPPSPPGSPERDSPVSQTALSGHNLILDSSAPDPFRRPSDGRSSGKVLCLRFDTSSLRSPDRFLPSRDSSDAVAEKFHSTMHPDQLSPTEKLLRNNFASPDSFSSWRAATNPRPAVSPRIPRAVSVGNRGPGGRSPFQELYT